MTEQLTLEQRCQRAQRLAGVRETRTFPLTDVELREGTDGVLHFRGYATVFNTDYDMYGGPDAYGWVERVAPTALDKTLSEKPDTQLLINHEGLPLARTKSGTLRLTADATGLLSEADLDASDPDVARLKPKMARGDVDEMSFAFRVMRQEWDSEYSDRTMLELNIDRGDVSVVNYGANPYTSASLRSAPDARAFAAALAEIRAGDALSASTVSILTDVLGLCSAADDAMDEAQETLADVLGIANPDDPEPDPEDAGKLGMSLDLAMRRIQAA